MTLLAGWNSIEAAAWVHDLLEKASLFLIAILAITIGVAYLYGHRRDYLSDEATRAAVAARQAAPVERKAGIAPSPEIQNPAAANQPVIKKKTCLALAVKLQPPSRRLRLPSGSRLLKKIVSERRMIARSAAPRSWRHRRIRQRESRTPRGSRYRNPVTFAGPQHRAILAPV